MTDNQINSFQELFEKYQLARRELHGNFNKLQKREKSINERYTPRNIFNRWRDSIEGKEWKQKQYEKQQGKCPDCSFIAHNVDYLEIDHIKSISTNPELAIDITNLRLVCSPCNKKKGGKGKS
jgi:5-methylcytosine-specific restriction endonuclease McrA